jgi:beta-lactamase class C
MFLFTYQLKKNFLKPRLFYAIIGFTLFSYLIEIKPGFCLPTKNIAPILATLDNHIRTQVQKKHIPGCAIAVVYKNQVIFMNAYGVKSIGQQDKIDLDTIFQLGSVSKPIAATLASVLENKGLLKLDDPVHYYLPRFSLKSLQSSTSTLKIKHILSHSTGVPRAGFNNLIEAHASQDSILKALQNTPVRTPAGRRYDYHNAMFGLVMSEITEATTHSSFKNALQINLLQPLNMTKTSSTLQGLLRNANRAFPHVRNRKGYLTPCTSYSKSYYTVSPAGGINSSIKDMAIFLKAQLGGYPQVLNHHMLKRIQTPQIHTNNNVLSTSSKLPHLIKDARYALGWRVVDFAHHKLIFHGGWVKGFTNFIGFMPDHNIGIVILHNGETRFSSKTAMKFFELFLEVPTPKKSITLVKKATKKVKKSKIKRTHQTHRKRHSR